MDFLELYSRFKNGIGFTLTLTFYITIVLILHIFHNYDNHFDNTDFVLSVEAAYTLPLLMMANRRIEEKKRLDEENRAQDLQYMKHIMQAIHTLLIEQIEKDKIH